MDGEQQGRGGDVHAQTTTAPQTDKIEANKVENEWLLRFDCETSVLYQQRLAHWYRQSNNLALLITLFASTAFFAQIPEDSWGIRVLISLAIAAFAIVAIVWQTQERSAFYANQSRRYALLGAEIDLPEADLARIRYDYRVIEADEVYSIRRNLMILCYNEVCYRHSNEGKPSWYSDAYLPLKWYQRVWPLPYLFDFDSEAPKPRAVPSSDKQQKQR